MVDEVAWPIELIPDSDNVFMRAHRAHFREGELQPGVFRQHGDGMSVDWDKYSTAQATRSRGAIPTDNAVIAARVGHIRGLSGLDVHHKPEQSNQAHSNVIGLPSRTTPELVEVRVKLLRISKVVLPLDL